ncbi:MAG: hypothetical protein Q8R78_05425 [Candidatus Omnitrophota bacterium]|nr:hypothetical protein [Candidatus Omnitrophota bacterium]
MYEARYCSRCAHNDDDKGCPVMNLHLLYNYDEANKDGSFLNVLIPRDERGFNAQCAMFLAGDDDSLGNSELYAKIVQLKMT